MPTGKSAQSGFTYLYVLMLIALIGMGLAAAGTLWRTEAPRAHEAELLFVGAQYRQAIRSYYELDPAQPRCRKASTTCWKTTAAPTSYGTCAVHTVTR